MRRKIKSMIDNIIVTYDEGTSVTFLLEPAGVRRWVAESASNC